MNVVFYLSEAKDFSPLYGEKIPPECFSYIEKNQSVSLFEKNFDLFCKHFPDMPHFIIDRSETSVFSKLYEGLDILNLPAKSLFTLIFLYSSFTSAFDLEPFALFYPANLSMSDFGSFSKSVQSALSCAEATLGLTLISAPGARPPFFKRGELLLKNRSIDLKKFSGFYSREEAEELEIENPHGFPGAFIFNSLSFMKFLPHFDPQLESLYFLLIDTWKDETSLLTVLDDTIRRLDEISFDDFLNRYYDSKYIECQSVYQKINDLRGLFRILPKDKNGNYTEGDVLVNSSSVMAVNRGSKQIRIDSLSHVAAFSNQDETRFFSL